MRLYSEKSVEYFEFWSGARDNAKTLTSSQLRELDNILSDMYPDGLSEVELNDLMWFEFDVVLEWLGITNEDGYED